LRLEEWNLTEKSLSFVVSLRNISLLPGLVLLQKLNTANLKSILLSNKILLTMFYTKTSSIPPPRRGGGGNSYIGIFLRYRILFEYERTIPLGDRRSPPSGGSLRGGRFARRVGIGSDLAVGQIRRRPSRVGAPHGANYDAYANSERVPRQGRGTRPPPGAGDASSARGGGRVLRQGRGTRPPPGAGDASSVGFF